MSDAICEFDLYSLHESRLSGIAVTSDVAILSFVNTGGVRCSMRLTGVDRLRADEFRQGNVVLRVDVEEVEDDDWRRVAHVFGMEPSIAARGWWASKVAELVRRGMLLVEIVPSYGCSMTVICREVTLVEEREPAVA